jgi:ABC-type branched-subunit amino acid transport system ATPase component
MGELLELKAITKSFGGVKALKDISFSVNNTEILGLIGPNGSGKTTLFNIISGFLKPDKGRIFYQKKDITGLPPHKRAQLGIGRLFQDIRIFDKLTVIDNLLLSNGDNSEGVLRAFVKTPIFNRKYKSKEVQTARHLLGFVGLNGKENALAQNLSYGQEKLLAIAMLLARDSRLILLDEPIAGVMP